MNNASSYGSGVGTGLALGMAMKKNAEDEARRKSNDGEDQILIQLKKGSFDQAVKVITDTYDWELYEGRMFTMKNPSYSYGGFAISFILLGLILLITEGIGTTSFGWIWGLVAISAISSIIGYINRDIVVGWLEIDGDRSNDSITIIQINKYDTSGYRNVDEKDIFRLIEKLREANLL